MRTRPAPGCSISATNPCHLYPFAQELAQQDALDCYYSGYPAWKLPAAEKLPLATHTWRTNIVYGLLKFAPAWARPEPKRLFTWQDRGFDAWVGRHLAECDFIHAMPGQALGTFRAARRRGIRTVLNHATGLTDVKIDGVATNLQPVNNVLTWVTPVLTGTSTLSYTVTTNSDAWATTFTNAATPESPGGTCVGDNNCSTTDTTPTLPKLTLKKIVVNGKGGTAVSKDRPPSV